MCFGGLCMSVDAIYQEELRGGFFFYDEVGLVTVFRVFGEEGGVESPHTCCVYACVNCI